MSGMEARSVANTVYVIESRARDARNEQSVDFCIALSLFVWTIIMPQCEESMYDCKLRCCHKREAPGHVRTARMITVPGRLYKVFAKALDRLDAYRMTCPGWKSL